MYFHLDEMSVQNPLQRNLERWAWTTVDELILFFILLFTTTHNWLTTRRKDKRPEAFVLWTAWWVLAALRTCLFRHSKLQNGALRPPPPPPHAHCNFAASPSPPPPQNLQFILAPGFEFGSPVCFLPVDHQGHQAKGFTKLALPGKS